MKPCKFASLALILFKSTSALAQVSTGVPAFGSFGGGPFDTVNLGNLNVHFTIPILHRAGRGVPFNYDLSYDNLIWQPSTVNGTVQWAPAATWGWTAQSLAALGWLEPSETYKMQIVKCSGGFGSYTTYTSTYTYFDWQGISHGFPGSTYDIVAGGGCGSGIQYGPTLRAQATDGSGYTLNAPANQNGVTITTRFGTLVYTNVGINGGAGTFQDANGNYLSFNSSTRQFFDTLSSTTAALTLAGSGTPSSPTTYTYAEPSGSNVSYTVNYTQYTVATNFGVSGVAEFGKTSVALVSSIQLPDLSEYQFTYEDTPGSCTPLSGTYSANCVTGRIASVTLPSGGTITYGYTGGSNGILSDGSTSGLTRTLNPGGEWQYSRSVISGSPGPGSTWTTTVEDPNTNYSISNFAEDATTNGTNTVATYNFFETQRTIYQGNISGNSCSSSITTNCLLMTATTCYNVNFASCATATVHTPITQTDYYVQPAGGPTRVSEMHYNLYGLLTEDKEYDYGVSLGAAPSSSYLLSDTSTSYDTTLTNGIVDRPSSIVVKDGNQTPVASTSYTYDQGSVTGTSGTPQHASIAGSRGNPTTITYQTNSGGSTVSRTYTYYDTGNLKIATDTNGATATYNYSSGSCGNSFVTSVSEPLSLSSSATLNCTGAVVGSVSDENGNPTSTTYNDPLLRITRIGNPDGGYTTYSYTPTQASIHTYQNSNTFSDTELLVEGFGRQSRSALSNGQNSNPWYQVDDCYDADGNLTFQSYQYQGNGFGAGKVCSGSGDSYSYDALGRFVKLTHSDGSSISYSYLGRATKVTDENGVIRISQIDGLGRPTIVCEISSNGSMPGSGSPVNCGTDASGTGFTTTFSYSLASHSAAVTQGAQTRTFQTDWIGRPILVQEPEVSGPTTYSYAYNATGLVVTRIRPRANQTNSSVTTATTTQYDAFGRMVTVSYNDGSDTKNFYYDQSIGWSNFPQNNLKGRLAGTKMTTSGAGMGYSYDVVGRMIGLQQCLGSTCGTGGSNLAYTYDWAGNLKSSTDGNGVTSTYTVSPAGELLSLTSSLSNSSNPPNILSNIQNGPHGPTGYTLGNGLHGVQSYDALGRISGGWICSGSTSPYCTGGTQVYGFTTGWTGVRNTTECDTVLNQCMNFGYDEFNRLTSRTVTSGTAQNFTYVYDRYGNRWQQNVTAGSGPSPQLSFNTSTNKVTGNGYAYDAAGNMTNDSFHAYSYDAEGNIVTVDPGTTAVAYNTYDALNHLVQNVIPRYSFAGQIVFNKDGYRVSYPGSNDGVYFWGAKRVGFYYSGQLTFQHQDWLGTERMRTTYNGGVAGAFTSLPFGDAWTTVSGHNYDAYHFAGMDEDTASSGTDFLGQYREYNPTQGRWLSPDLYAGSYDLSSPQSFNRYAYVMNNSLSFIDPRGLQLIGPVRCGDGPNDCPGGTISSNPFDPTGGGSVWGAALSGGLYYTWVPQIALQQMGTDFLGNPLYSTTTGYWQIGGFVNQGGGDQTQDGPRYPYLPPWLPGNRHAQGPRPGPPTKPPSPRPVPGAGPDMGPFNEPPSTNTGRFWYILMQLLRVMDNNINPPVIPIFANPCVIDPKQPYCPPPSA